MYVVAGDDEVVEHVMAGARLARDPSFKLQPPLICPSEVHARPTPPAGSSPWLPPLVQPEKLTPTRTLGSSCARSRFRRPPC